jgi:hypothetical protein
MLDYAVKVKKGKSFNPSIENFLLNKYDTAELQSPDGTSTLFVSLAEQSDLGTLILDLKDVEVLSIKKR